MRKTEVEGLECLLVVLKAATFYSEDFCAPHGDTSGVWLKGHWGCCSNGAKFAWKKKNENKNSHENI